jgi:TRAP-type mannitol/chloroaromatic compound transport system permease large subunit
LPEEARTFVEPNGGRGLPSLLLLMLVSVLVSVGYLKVFGRVDAPVDERIVLGILIWGVSAFVVAVINKVLKLGLLSQIAERVTFVMIPPLALIFLVLGTIFIGVATPTEGGAMGAVGAIIMALLRRRLNLTLLRQAMDTTATLSCFVVFILIGSTVFGLTFRGVNGDLWVEHLLIGLPGGQMGFLIVVSLMTFVLAFFLDFFELAFIIVPLLGPVADKMGIDLIWFGVLLAVNMQTSFMHPPFGFALFYLRSVAPKDDYRDKVTGKMIAKVTTGDIYWGSIPFIVIQLIMVAMVLLVPGMVTHYKQGVVKMDIESVKIDIDGAYGDQGGYGESQGYYGDVHVDPAPSSEGAPAAAGDGASASDEEFNNLFK